LTSPLSSVDWLRANLPSRQIVPYVLDAAKRTSARVLEGPTYIDALFINLTNGFTWLIEAKVLSDVSYSISFDKNRNQIARNLNVMLDAPKPHDRLKERNQNRSLFALLAPARFKLNPSSRLYGRLIPEYKAIPSSLQRALPHRTDIDWDDLSRRIGWFTFNDVELIRPGTCEWPL
jgi:hypothetical protein